MAEIKTHRGIIQLKYSGPEIPEKVKTAVFVVTLANVAIFALSVWWFVSSIGALVEGGNGWNWVGLIVSAFLIFSSLTKKS